MHQDAQRHAHLQRKVGVFGAVMLGLGSIIGSGIFVSIGMAAGVTGPSVLLAIVLAAFVATCNGLSSAQLAAHHPVSGGTYEYGYRWLHPIAGFTAGWMFLCAKSASAATAALGFSGYLLNLLRQPSATSLVPLALCAVFMLTLLVVSGIRRSSVANAAIVSLTLLALMVFVIWGLPGAMRAGTQNFSPFFAGGESTAWSAFFEATALMFVAFTGYGRVATLGEEIRDPFKSIPLAIIITLLVATGVYLLVGGIAIAAAGADILASAASEQAAPLEVVARRLLHPFVATIVAAGAVTAMLGVLLNLVLGLSRVVLAMSRRRDMPVALSRLDQTGETPRLAVIFVGLVIAGLTLIGDVKTTWSFSAFTVLVYYALTNLAALRLSRQERLYPRLFAWLGLVACLLLAFFVEPKIWMTGLALIAVGLVWQQVVQRLQPT